VPENQQKSEVVFPFFQLSGKEESSFQKEAKIIFSQGDQFVVMNKDFQFTSGTIKKRREFNHLGENLHPNSRVFEDVPYFSMASIVLIIGFRNLYFTSFQKNFTSILNNFEIDFNFQKIGFMPILLSVFIILFSISGFFIHPEFPTSFDIRFYINILRIPVEILGYPLLISAVSLFFLSLSGKIFPLIFSDIKIYFGLSFLLILWNIFAFGSDIELIISLNSFVITIVTLYFVLRSFLFFQVLRKAYRFQMPLTLFYICALNLSTFLVLFKVLAE